MKVVTFEYASYEDFYYFTYEFDDNKSEQEIMKEYKEAVKEVPESYRIQVEGFTGLLVDFAKKKICLCNYKRAQGYFRL